MLISSHTPEEWIALLCESGAHPAPHLLKAQFLAGTVTERCNCGCASFAILVPANSSIASLAPPGKPGAAFEADFRIVGSECTIEVILMVDKTGNLSYVEVDCCANSYPVPSSVTVEVPAYHVYENRGVAF